MHLVYVAVGVLLSFDPELKKEHDNKPSKMALVSHGRAYHQLFYNLLTEVGHSTEQLTRGWNFLGNATFHTTSVMWNLGLTWKTSTLRLLVFHVHTLTVIELMVLPLNVITRT